MYERLIVEQFGLAYWPTLRSTNPSDQQGLGVGYHAKVSNRRLMSGKRYPWDTVALQKLQVTMLGTTNGYRATKGCDDLHVLN